MWVAPKGRIPFFCPEGAQHVSPGQSEAPPWVSAINSAPP